MAGEWREETLDQLGRIVTGKTPPSKSGGLFEGEIPFVTPTDFDGRRVIDSTKRCLTEEGARAVSSSRLPGRAVMVSCIGSDMGKSAIAGRACVTNQQINSIVVESGNDPLFVYYCLSTRQAELRTAAGGSAVPILNKSAFCRFTINLPPFSEQRAIAHILGTLDDKIELNRRISETLESMARALFKSWFVDFDPVRARAEGRDPGLSEPLADLFPDSFEDSELGEIPRGWAARELREILRESNERISDVDAPEYSSTNTGLQLRSERFNKELSASSAKNKLIRSGFLVFGLSRRVLNFGLMRDRIGSVSSAYKVFAVDQEMVTPDLLERQMRLQPNYFYNAVSASSREGQSVSTEGLGLLRFVQPAPPVQDAFYGITRALSDRTKILQVQSHSLAALRDTLLPQLVGGELRVEDAEKCIARVDR